MLTTRSRTTVDTYDLKERIKKTEYLVEAASTDNLNSLGLWREWSEEAREMGYRGPRELPSFKWVQHSGVMFEVGRLDDRPVAITIMWNEIGGALIGFYEATSQAVDHEMIRKFLDEKFKGVPRTDASGFGRVVGYLQERDPANVVVLEHASRTIGLGLIEGYEETGLLTTQLLQGHALEKSRREYHPEKSDRSLDPVMAKIERELSPLNEAVEEFARLVWSRWLKKHYREQDYRGLEANVGNVNMLVWGIAGRVMVSLRVRDMDETEGRRVHLTLIGADAANDMDNLGIQGINMRGATATLLVQEATRLSVDLSNDIRPNEKVGMG